ncbi:hydroxypyruvate isomerase [Thioclava sp. DLFJ5-1]|uniref:hydroxypyruvate isomerase family protein n=1 Tax=Thioclava sp. DLFJ5-1 TaxID=1915314 RepID=UPI0009967E1C|nr:TIM barrel protein [Thioclava sp. DLFJ5-1]OOY21633.1 hydroxypyruvate isomerase [Thioclava sp. DLFJ5-1]
MPKFAANLTFLFTELPFMERFKAAKQAGFDAVEVLFPYDASAQEMRHELIRHDLSFVLMNVPPPNYTGGGRGFAAVPGLEDRFRRDFDRAMRFADILKPRVIHIMAGKAEGAEARATYIENLNWAAARAPKRRLTIEPINPIDMPGYFLNDFDLAAEILDAVAAPNLHLQFDAYHAQMLTGDVAGAWAKHGHRAAHVQFADAPGRGGPGSGKIDLEGFFATLDADGYEGYASAEYTPQAETRETLGWLPR